MNVILNHRLPAIQISDKEFKYLTGAELVAIIQDKTAKIESLTKENDELKVKLDETNKLVDTITKSKSKKEKRDDSNGV